MKTLYAIFISLILSFTVVLAGQIQISQLTRLNTHQLPKSKITINKSAIINELIKEHFDIPGGTGSITHISEIDFNMGKISPERFAFIGGDGKKQTGVYVVDDRKMKLIASNKTYIPKGTGFFTGFSHVNFDTKSGGAMFIGKGILGQEGIYWYNGEKLIKLVDQRTVIPGIKDLFKHFYHLAFYHGAALFLATGQSTPIGVYVYSQKKVSRIITALDKINNRPIKGFEISRFSLERGEAVFRIKFQDGKQAIYKVKLFFNPY